MLRSPRFILVYCIAFKGNKGTPDILQVIVPKKCIDWYLHS